MTSNHQTPTHIHIQTHTPAHTHTHTHTPSITKKYLQMGAILRDRIQHYK